ncbi:MAG: SurA N-terminal domain-containing protein [Pseudomonadota bacterium]
MLAGFRKFAKSPFAAILLGLLVVSFALFGISDIFTPKIGQDVIKVGSRTVSMDDFRRDFDNYKKGLEQQYGQPISPELAVQEGLDRRILEELALRESFAELMSKLGLHASDKMLTDELSKATAFFDPITGKFDKARYAQVLGENGLTPALFERQLNDDMRQKQYIAAAAAGLRAPRAYSALAGAFGLEQRDLAFFVIDPRTVGVIPTPTDAEILAFMKENAAQLTLPEFRALTVMRISRKAHEGGVTVDPAAVQKQFDFQKDSLSKPELRSVVQIPAKDAAQAQVIIDRLNKGENPNVVAGSLGVQPVQFADKPRTAFFDPAVAAAAFQLPVNGVSGPIKSQFGTAVLKVTKVTPGVTATLEQHRAALEAKVRTDLAAQKVSDIAKVYEDAHAAGADMAGAAAKAGLTLDTIPPVTADGRGQDAKPTGIPPAILKAAFELAQGGESDIQDAGDGEYFVVRVDRVVPPTLPPLAEVKPAMTRAIMLRRAAERMQKKAEELAARVKKGETMEAVAASAGVKVVTATGLSRAGAGQYKELGRELLGATFAAKKGEPFTARGQQFGIGVGLVTAIRPAEVQVLAQATNQQTRQFTEDLFKDLAESARAYARSTLKAETNLANARLAIGAEPGDALNVDGKKPAAPASKAQ